MQTIKYSAWISIPGQKILSQSMQNKKSVKKKLIKAKPSILLSMIAIFLPEGLKLQ